MLFARRLFLVVAGYGFLVSQAHGSTPWSLGAVDAFSRETPDLSRGRYLATRAGLRAR